MITILFFTALSLSCGCQDNDRQEIDRRNFRALSAEALELYHGLHPLRSSRLGFHSSDSLLFTFSDREIDHYASRVRNLLERFSALPAQHIQEEGITASQLLTHWLKGELFSLEKLMNYRFNPLLYCWMVEEALLGIPYRPGPPAEGELEAYQKRLSRIPALLENAMLLLEKPAASHVSFAAERTGELLEAFPYLEGYLFNRYGRKPAFLPEVKERVERFHGYISENLSRRSHGRLLLGSEDLSNLLRYSEHLDTDLIELASEAQREIQKLMPRRNLSGEGMSTLPPEREGEKSSRSKTGPASLMQAIENKIARHPELGGENASVPDIIHWRKPFLPDHLPTNPYLTVPPPSRHNFAVTFSGPPCRPFLLLPPQADNLDENRLLHRLLHLSSPLVSVFSPCGAKKTEVRDIISSETYRAGWEAEIFTDLMRLWPERGTELHRIEADEKRHYLARTVVVIQLHGGIFTTDAAADFLAESLGLDEDGARREVFLCSAFPSLALEGISLIWIDKMTKKLSSTREQRDRHDALRRLLRDNRSLPLPYIMKQISN
ncbi:MAG: hypothetical protein JXB45_11955 [Candidatus Krumholzibacteriota bacterium]|nr:hypothetical protein [Candidatus Krumholzibacteriota bacterium]